MARRDDLRWDDLRHFLRAAQSGSLSGAARAMGVKHTTIGRRLTALERSLGAPLMLRRPDGLHLTPLGAEIAPLIEEVERAVLAITGLVDTRKAHVRVATPSGLAKLLSENLALLRREHPEIALEIVGGARPVDLKKGEADIAIRLGPIADNELIVRKLCDAGFSLYASAAYLARRPAPRDPNDLSDQEIIGYDATLARTPMASWIDSHASRATIVLRSRDMVDVLSAALGGVGLALLPCALADEETGLRRLTDEVIVSLPVSIAYAREARISGAMRSVIRFVTTMMRQEAHRISGRK